MLGLSIIISAFAVQWLAYGWALNSFWSWVLGTALAAVAGWCWQDYWKKRIVLKRGRREWE
jgi:hypothetical protein